MAEPHGASSHDYTLDQLLGRGMTSDIYLGHYGPAGVVVLLKRFHVRNVDPAKLNKLRWQVLWVGAARLPGLAWMRALEQDEEGRPVLILQRAGEETLEQFLARNEGGLEPGAALLLARRLAAALQQAAELGLDYELIEPATIMLEDGTDPVLLGFDLASVFDLAALAEEASAAQLAFLAPEQRTGRSSDVRSLVYSLGALLAAMLAPGWPSELEAGAEAGSGADPAAVLAQLEDSVTGETSTLLRTALQAEPALRYHDLEGFLRAADEALRAEGLIAGEATSATTLSAVTHGWKASSLSKGATGATRYEPLDTESERLPMTQEAPSGLIASARDAYRARRHSWRLPMLLLYLFLGTIAVAAILLILEPGALDSAKRQRATVDSALPPTPTLFGFGVPATPLTATPSDVPAAAPIEPAVTNTVMPVLATATPTLLPATATRSSPTPTQTRVTATLSPTPSPTAFTPSPTAVIVVPSGTPFPTVTGTSIPPTEPPPPPATEPPPTQQPPPPPTDPPPPPTETPFITPTAPAP
jgi:serine/threonine protein kinase